MTQQDCSSYGVCVCITVDAVKVDINDFKCWIKYSLFVNKYSALKYDVQSVLAAKLSMLELKVGF